MIFDILRQDAEMMESVDMTDLKSVGHCGRVGSSPILGTIKISEVQESFRNMA